MLTKVTNTKLHHVYDWKCGHSLCCGDEDKCSRDDCQAEGRWRRLLVLEAQVVMIEHIPWEGHHKDFQLKMKTNKLPYLVSKVPQKIEDGEMAYNAFQGHLFKYGINLGVEGFNLKVLATPSDFAPEHYQALIDKKLTVSVSETVLVECEYLANPIGENSKRLHEGSSTLTIIKLNESNHISLYKTPKEEAKKYTKQEVKSIVIAAFCELADNAISGKDFTRWFDLNLK